MKKESLPHLPLSLAEAFDALFSKDYKLFQVSSLDRLGYRLMDLALYLLSSQEKIRLLITDTVVLESFTQRAEEIGLSFKVDSPGRIYLEWSHEIYPSQKTLAVDKIYSQLNQKVGHQSMYLTVVKNRFNRAIPRSESVENSELSKSVIHQVNLAYSLYNPIVNYAELNQLLQDEIDFNILQKEVVQIEGVIDDVLDVISLIDQSNYDISSLRRMNHTSTNALVNQLYSTYRKVDEVINSLSQINIEELKQPMNAATLTTHLKGRIVDWCHLCGLLSTQSVIEWLSVINELPWDIAVSLWDYAKYKVKEPWLDVLLLKRVQSDLGNLDFMSSRMKFVDCQHLLRVKFGNVEERIEIFVDESLLNSEDDTLTLIPDHLQGSAVNPLRYEVVSTLDSLPLHNELFTGGKVNDSQFLSNSKVIAQLLSNLVANLEVYMSRTQIFISTLHHFTNEVSEALLKCDFEKVHQKSTKEVLEQCLVDSNRQVSLLILGSLLTVDDISDWVYQIQLLEALEATGIKIIDVPIHISPDKKLILPQTLSSVLLDYVEG